jgi:hypothetical protein
MLAAASASCVRMNAGDSEGATDCDVVCSRGGVRKNTRARAATTTIAAMPAYTALLAPRPVSPARCPGRCTSSEPARPRRINPTVAASVTLYTGAATGPRSRLTAQVRTESRGVLYEAPVFLETVVDDFLKPKRQRRIEHNRRDGRLSEDGREDDRRRLPGERLVSGQRLVNLRRPGDRSVRPSSSSPVTCSGDMTRQSRA